MIFNNQENIQPVKKISLIFDPARCKRIINSKYLKSQSSKRKSVADFNNQIINYVLEKCQLAVEKVTVTALLTLASLVYEKLSFIIIADDVDTSTSRSPYPHIKIKSNGCMSILVNDTVVCHPGHFAEAMLMLAGVYWVFDLTFSKDNIKFLQLFTTLLQWSEDRLTPQLMNIFESVC